MGEVVSFIMEAERKAEGLNETLGTRLAEKNVMGRCSPQ